MLFCLGIDTNLSSSTLSNKRFDDHQRYVSSKRRPAFPFFIFEIFFKRNDSSLRPNKKSVVSLTFRVLDWEAKSRCVASLNPTTYALLQSKIRYGIDNFIDVCPGRLASSVASDFTTCIAIGRAYKHGVFCFSSRNISEATVAYWMLDVCPRRRYRRRATGLNHPE